MLDASTQEDRTRPALDGTIGARLRYFSWPRWRGEGQPAAPTYEVMMTAAKLGRR